MRRILIAGTGLIGLKHLRLFSEREDLIIEVCDIRPEGRMEAERVSPRARQWSNFADALESGPDIVLIATPPSSHYPLTQAAMQSGAHVFCEKPMADTLEAARSMVVVQQKSGRLLNIGFVQRFAPELVQIRQKIREGLIGRVSYARFSVGTLVTLEFSRSRHQQDVYGAAVLDYVYGFDTFWWVLGEQPRGVYARGIQAEGLPFTSNPNVVSAVVDYASARIAEIHIDYVAQPQRASYFFQGDKGYFHLDYTRKILQHGDTASRQIVEEPVEGNGDDVFRLQRDHFLAAVEGRQEVSTSAVDALHGSAGVEALIRSLKSGQRETVAE